MPIAEKVFGPDFHSDQAAPGHVSWLSIPMSGLAAGAVMGIMLNAILTGKNHEFGAAKKSGTWVNFQV